MKKILFRYSFLHIFSLICVISLTSCGNSSSISSSRPDSSNVQSSKDKSVSNPSSFDNSSSNNSKESSSSSNIDVKCDHKNIINKKVNPTCTSEGFDISVCLDCGQINKTNIVKKLDHSYTYNYAIYSGTTRRYEERKMCKICGQTLSGNTFTKSNNKVAYKDENNIISTNNVGFVISTNNGIKAIPAIGYEFYKWSNGETNDTLNVADNSLIAIFKHITTEFPIVSVNLNNGITLENVKRDLARECSIEVETLNDISTSTGTFKGRGNGSWVGYSGKSGYTIKLDKKAKFAGMNTKAKKWNLIACKDDETMHINYGAYELSHKVFGGIEYQPENKFVQLYVNNEYRGAYMLTDAIKVESGRVDAICENEAGDYDYENNNPGFLIEYDRYSRSNSSDKPYDPSGDVTPKENMSYFSVNGLYRDFSIKYPDTDDAKFYGGDVDDNVFKNTVLKIKSCIQNVADILSSGNFENLQQYVDLDSMIDMYCLHELFKNSDVGWSSFYIYKKTGENVIRFGPAWDFDLSAIYSRTPQIEGKHISTKSLNGDPNNSANSTYNDILVKATKLKNSSNRYAFAELLNSKFDANKNKLIKKLIEIYLNEDRSYFGFALNNKKWKYTNYAYKIQETFEWLINRTSWMLNNDFVK